MARCASPSRSILRTAPPISPIWSARGLFGAEGRGIARVQDEAIAERTFKTVLARAPGHDSYWRFHRDRFLELAHVGHHSIRRLGVRARTLLAITAATELDGRHAGCFGWRDILVETVSNQDAGRRRQIEIWSEQVIDAGADVFAAEMGKVMGAASKQLAGKADNKMVAAIVKELLSQ